MNIGVEIGTSLLAFLIILGIGFVGLVVFVIMRVIRAHQQRVVAGREEMVGRTAEVVETLNPKGTVLVEGERWAAILDEGRAEPGEEVLITRVESLKLYVTKKR